MNESYDFEDRKYINPTISRDEQLSFIDNLRSTQQADIDKIVRDTHNLGTDVSSIEGGLNGATNLWTSQYVTPKTDTIISSLRASAQAQALNDVLGNAVAQMKQRYNEAYRAANKRKNANSAGGTTGSNGIKGEVEYISNDEDTAGKEVAKVEPNYSPMTGTWEYTRAGTAPSKIYVEYDEYGRPKRVVDGAYGDEAYEGEDAVTYWNKIKGLNYSNSKRVE